MKKVKLFGKWWNGSGEWTTAGQQVEINLLDDICEATEGEVLDSSYFWIISSEIKIKL
jgi:hypothetical protein